MAGVVEQMIVDAVRAALHQDRELAEATLEHDATVNRLEVESDELCLLILAKWHPLASDLRFVTLALKMVTDLERIGDLAVNICERALDLAACPPVRSYDNIVHIADLVQSMVRDAIDAFVHADDEKAQRVIDRDAEVDDRYHETFRALLETMLQDPSSIERGIHLQSVAKWLERMADHAPHIAGQVI